MFRKIMLLSVLLLSPFFGCGSSTDSSTHDVTAKRLQVSVDSNWSQYKQAHGLPVGGMAVYIESPSGNYFASSGMQAGVDQNTRFRIASITKTFTAAAIMLLNQQGMLNIEDTIVSYIPGQSMVPYVPNTPQYNIPNKASITIRQLLSHTAGVFDVTNDNIPSTCPAPYAGMSYVSYVTTTDPNHQFSPDEFVGVDATCQTSYFAPGAGYHYSNTGYSILSTIIERVSGIPYDRFVIQNLIAPNELSSTSVPMLAADRAIPPPFNPGYVFYQGAFTDTTQDNMSANIAEGNLISTPADLARWGRRLIRGEAGPNSASVDKMKTGGLGIDYVAGLGYGKDGAHAGYLSQMLYDPTVDVTTVVYFNVWDYANLFTDQAVLLKKAALDARTALGY